MVNSQYLRSPGVSTMPQQMSASLPGYNSGYQAGLAAAQGNAQQTALIEQRQHPVNKFKEGYEAGLAAAKYKAGYEAGLHALRNQIVKGCSEACSETASRFKPSNSQRFKPSNSNNVSFKLRLAAKPTCHRYSKVSATAVGDQSCAGKIS